MNQINGSYILKVTCPSLGRRTIRWTIFLPHSNLPWPPPQPQARPPGRISRGFTVPITGWEGGGVAKNRYNRSTTSSHGNISTPRKFPSSSSHHCIITSKHYRNITSQHHIIASSHWCCNKVTKPENVAFPWRNKQCLGLMKMLIFDVQ